VNVRTGQGGGRRRQPFSVSAWETRNYLPQAAYGSIPGAPSNDCHWPPASGRGSAYLGLYHAALAQTDAAKRCELVHAMQALEYRYGGYIIPFFASLVDSHSRRVAGFGVAKTGQNLDSFGHGYRTIWFTA
jgi:peptide/nickel transport system substrate-binding protein